MQTRTRSRLRIGIAAVLVCLLTVGGVRLYQWYRDRPVLGPDGLHDPIEYDPDYQPALRAAEQEATEEMKDQPFGLGWAPRHDMTKQRILKEKYGIRWRTPMELNPNKAFD